SLKQFDKTLWRYHKPFSVLGSCQQKFLLQTSDQLVLVENGKAYKLSNPNSIIELHSNNKWQVVVKNDDLSAPEIILGKCDVIFNQLKKNGAIELLKRDIPTVVSSKVESFPSLHHFKPHYWLLGYKGGDNVSSWIASTTLSDPLDRHVLFLNASLYPSIAMITPDVSYNYDFNSWIFELSQSKQFTASEINLDVDKDRITTVSIS